MRGVGSGVTVGVAVRVAVGQGGRTVGVGGGVAEAARRVTDGVGVKRAALVADGRVSGCSLVAGRVVGAQAASHNQTQHNRTGHRPKGSLLAIMPSTYKRPSVGAAHTPDRRQLPHRDRPPFAADSVRRPAEDHGWPPGGERLGG